MAHLFHGRRLCGLNRLVGALEDADHGAQFCVVVVGRDLGGDGAEQRVGGREHQLVGDNGHPDHAVDMAHEVLKEDGVFENKVNDAQPEIQSFPVDGVGRCRAGRRYRRPRVACCHVQLSLALVRREPGAIAPRANKPAGLERRRGDLDRARGNRGGRSCRGLGAGIPGSQSAFVKHSRSR